MSCIQKAVAKIKNLKISNTELVSVPVQHNVNTHFQRYRAFLSHDAQEKEKLPSLSKLTKSLKDKQICLSNENKKTNNYAHSSKHKMSKLSEQKEKVGKDEKVDNKEEIKKQKVKKYKTYRGKNKKVC